MLRVIFFLLVLGALVNGGDNIPGLVTPLKVLEDFAIDSSKKRGSSTNARIPSKIKRRFLFPHSQEGHGEGTEQDFDTAPLFDFLHKIQEPDHYLYMLYIPSGTVSQEIKSCFYIGVSNNIKKRLKYHMKAQRTKRKNIKKWDKIHELQCVGICELFKGSKGDCLFLEKEIVSQEKLLKINLVNVHYKRKYVRKPDPAKTGYFRQLMELGLESGEKYDSTMNYSLTLQEEIELQEEIQHGSDKEGDWSANCDAYESEAECNEKTVLEEEKETFETANLDDEDEEEESDRTLSEYELGDYGSDED